VVRVRVDDAGEQRERRAGLGRGGRGEQVVGDRADGGHHLGPQRRAGAGEREGAGAVAGLARDEAPRRECGERPAGRRRVDADRGGEPDPVLAGGP
jgi:hypothetical protein